MLADGGSDVSYTGETGGSAFSLDYYRAKYLEFQQTLNAIDLAYQAGVATQAITATDEIAELLADYESRASTIKATAEALNLGANLINSAGGRMPALSIPGTLGMPALVLPAVVLAAVASAGAAIGWGLGFTAAMRSAIATVESSEAAPEVKAAISEQLRAAENAQSLFNLSPLSALAKYAKWGAIAALAFIAWKAYKSVRSD